MKRLLACAIMLILAKACGVEEPYDTDFISITQAGPDSLTDGNRHRPHGKHANAYLINKVHVLDYDFDDNRSDRPTLTVNVNVGAWLDYPTDPPDDCSCLRKKLLTNGEAFEKETGESCCVVNYCTGTRDAGVIEVNKALDMWLAPLRTPYGSTNNPIISGDFITVTSKRKAIPDLTVNFICSDFKSIYSWANGPRSLNCSHTEDYKGGCYGYNKVDASGANSDHYSKLPTDPPDGLHPTMRLPKHNTPIIWLGNDSRDENDPSKEKGYDEIGKHDRLDLLHNIGHVFGLWNTHKSQ